LVEYSKYQLGLEEVRPGLVQPPQLNQSWIDADDLVLLLLDDLLLVLDDLVQLLDAPVLLLNDLVLEETDCQDLGLA